VSDVGPPSQPNACLELIVSFDFENKKERRITIEDARSEIDAGRFVWVDANVADADEGRRLLGALSLVADELVDEALTGEPATQLARYEKYLHIALTGCRLKGTVFELERVDVFVSDKFLLTIHKDTPQFIQMTRRDYRDDFYRFAKSPSFLVYELWDHLLENYLSIQKKFEERVEVLQRELIADVDDDVFSKLSALGADLLHFRKVLLPARSVLSELSTRRSSFISEATQPFLANMVGTIERVLQDLLVDRDILSESLNLHMSMVGHRTNRVMNRLTVVSIIFLPLTFLCGVYGMNFEVLPETKWEHGYLFFWVLVLLIAASLVWVMKKNRLL
jgi:magnesium transporter